MLDTNTMMANDLYTFQLRLLFFFLSHFSKRQLFPTITSHLKRIYYGGAICLFLPFCLCIRACYLAVHWINALTHVCCSFYSIIPVEMFIFECFSPRPLQSISYCLSSLLKRPKPLFLSRDFSFWVKITFFSISP